MSVGSAGGKASGKVWIDGHIVDAGEARVPVLDRGFLYGDSVYEVTRSFGGEPFALGEHLDRLAGSAARIGMTLPPRDVVERATREAASAVSAAGGGDVYLRIIVTRGCGPIGLDPALADAPRLVVIALPLALPDERLYREGADVAIVGARRNAPGSIDPQVKSGNYLNSVMAIAEARAHGAYEALMCDTVGRIAEGSSSNFFLVRGGRISTPPLSVGLLEGITRRHVIAIARELGIPVDEVNLWPVDVRHSEEAFITSSVRGVMPVRAVEGERVGAACPGPITARIAAAYEAHARAAGGSAAADAD